MKLKKFLSIIYNKVKKLSQYFYPKFNFEIIRLRSRNKKLLQDNNLLVIRK